MNYINLLALKDNSMDVGTGALYSIVSILMVFAILLIIIGVTTLVFKLTGLFEMKKQVEEAAKKNNIVPTVAPVTNEVKSVEITDDDMMAAVLVATIDYRNEVKKDVRLVSVKEVK
jgi:glutaconyl-CoA/methylmalonyl-CoA decarboxylase subunit delta